MNIRTTSLAFLAFLALLAGGTLAGSAAADEGSRQKLPPLPVYQQECGACHVAYPPGLLPAPSWKRLMGGLDRHFGTDASLDADAVRRIAAWLEANAGTYKRVREEPPQDRITTSSWFVRKHREVPADAWRRPAVKSAANCAACHPNASEGVFHEHDVRIPR